MCLFAGLLNVAEILLRKWKLHWEKKAVEVDNIETKYEFVDIKGKISFSDKLFCQGFFVLSRQLFLDDFDIFC